jgi:hypothetical protein
VPPGELQLPYHDAEGNTEDYDEIRVEPATTADGGQENG